MKAFARDRACSSFWTGDRISACKRAREWSIKTVSALFWLCALQCSPVDVEPDPTRDGGKACKTSGECIGGGMCVGGFCQGGAVVPSEDSGADASSPADARDVDGGTDANSADGDDDGSTPDYGGDAGDDAGDETGTDAGVDAGLCGRTTCAGCCDQAGACQAGSSVAACGKDGVSCEDCSVKSEQCKNNQCMNPQSCEFTCGGCCDYQGRCQVGDASDSCGTGGEPCQNCSTSGKSCKGGSCTSPQCTYWNCGYVSEGCCDVNDTCQPGTTETVCGGKGNPFDYLCEDCTLLGSDFKCIADRHDERQCLIPCAAANCPTGCCDKDNNCKSGTELDFCGNNGEPCDNCNSLVEKCINRSCQL